MATAQPPGEITPPPDDMTTTAPAGAAGGAPSAGAPPEKHHSAWLWISVALAIAVVGLLVYGLNKRSDLSDAQAENAQLQSQSEQQKDNGTAIVATMKSAFDDLTQGLGATNEDLQQTQEDLDQAEKDAAAAKQDAAESKSQVDEANAKADEAKANSAVVADCAKAYLSAFGQLFDGTGADQVKQDLQGVTADCKGALGGS